MVKTELSLAKEEFGLKLCAAYKSVPTPGVEGVEYDSSEDLYVNVPST